QDILNTPLRVTLKAQSTEHIVTQEIALVVQAEDADGDGMPDGWEVRFGIDPTQNDANEDPDGDGFTNHEEFVAGSDPLDPNSNPDNAGDEDDQDEDKDPRSGTIPESGDGGRV